MIWIALAAIGVPVWLCALAIVTVVLRNRSLRLRAGDIPMRFRETPGTRWIRGHGIWTHDVLAFRGSPAMWRESLIWVTAADAEVPDAEDRKRLHRLGDDPVVARLSIHGGGAVEAAVDAKRREDLLGPFASSGPRVERTDELIDAAGTRVRESTQASA